jgi:hypothetical protein
VPSSMSATAACGGAYGFADMGSSSGWSVLGA